MKHKIGDIIVIDNKEYKIIHFISDGPHTEYCLKDLEKNTSKWYFLFNTKRIGKRKYRLLQGDNFHKYKDGDYCPKNIHDDGCIDCICFDICLK
jgi:signal peptidase I